MIYSESSPKNPRRLWRRRHPTLTKGGLGGGYEGLRGRTSDLTSIYENPIESILLILLRYLK